MSVRLSPLWLRSASEIVWIEAVTRLRLLFVAAGVRVTITILGAVVMNQVKVYRGRQARAALLQQRHPAVPQPPAVAEQRQALFEMLQPVALTNCELERFGEAHDGGYLMCGNLLGGVQSGYWYGISGYDKWGCDISSQIQSDRPPIRLLQYDPAGMLRGRDRVSCGMRRRHHRDDRRARLRHDQEPVGKEWRQFEAHRAEDRRRGRGVGLPSVHT